MQSGFNNQEIKLFKKLNSPQKIQDFLNKLKANFEEKVETCYSPRLVIKHKKAHCVEGAMFAAAALEFNGQKPLILDLRSVDSDFDHVVAVFKKFGCFGAISKTNHAVLRYREPVYKTLRELVLSYFHEYFDDKGNKTLREYSRLFNLSYFDNLEWRTTINPLFQIPDFLDNIKHYKIFTQNQIEYMRKADGLEIKAGKLVQYKI